MYVYCDKYYVCKDEMKERCFRKMSSHFEYWEEKENIYRNIECKEVFYKELKIKYISDFEALMIRRLHEK